jgi:uncharacterized protein DUF4345
MARQIRTTLKAFLIVLGLVAIGAGLSTVLLGVDSIAGAEEVSGTVDSEMRFYAAWYVGAGVLLLWSAVNLERARSLIRLIAGILFLSGLSRALSWVTVGDPHVLTRVLMVLELTLPIVIVAWYSGAMSLDDQE